MKCTKVQKRHIKQKKPNESKMIINIIISLIFPLFFIGLEGFSQIDENIIYWNKERKLTWDDFKGTPEPTNGRIASNVGGVYIYFKQLNFINIEVKVVNVFDKKLSWTTTNLLSVLEHEQLHSDIREVHARLLRKQIIESHFKSIKEANLKVQEFHNLIQTDLNLMQEEYDKETGLSGNQKKQKEWNEKIRLKLLELENFAQSTIIIKIDK